MGSPGAVQSVSTAHCRHVVPTQTGPAALPAQCVLFWHCTHIIVARLQARLFMGAAVQSASDMQRSWQLALLPLMMQTCGAVQPAVGVHTRHVLVGTLQYGAFVGHVVSSTHCTHVFVAGLQAVRFIVMQLALERHSTQRPVAVSQKGVILSGLQLASPHGVRGGPESFEVPPSLPAVPPLPADPLEPPVPLDPPVTLVPPRPALPAMPPVPPPSSSPPHAGATVAAAPNATKSQASRYLVMSRLLDLERRAPRFRDARLDCQPSKRW
jgi:hypothetical protein